MTLTKKTYLVQRLKRPYRARPGSLLEKLDGVFSFGGGFKNGGLTDEAFGLLAEHFRFDYMGSAEYEFGAVPRAFSGIAAHAHNGELVPHHFTIDSRTVAASWEDKGVPPAHETTIYVLCCRDDTAEVQFRISEMARLGYTYRAKESINLDRTLRPYNDFDGEVQGWLELDNGYLFFTDREMAQGVAALFGCSFNLQEIPDFPPPTPPTREEVEARRRIERHLREKTRAAAKKTKSSPPRTMCGWQRDVGTSCLNSAKFSGTTPSALKASVIPLCGTHRNMAVKRGWKVHSLMMDVKP